MKARAVLTQPFSSSRRSRVYSSMTLFYIPEVDWKPFLRRSAGLYSQHSQTPATEADAVNGGCRRSKR